MVMVNIDDAPFTDEEKEQIKQMGIEAADWGHPDVVLNDPVAHFKRSKEVYDSFGPSKQSDFGRDTGPQTLERVPQKKDRPINPDAPPQNPDGSLALTFEDGTEVSNEMWENNPVGSFSDEVTEQEREIMDEVLKEGE